VAELGFELRWLTQVSVSSVITSTAAGENEITIQALVSKKNWELGASGSRL
jgi:hypothetical protein